MLQSITYKNQKTIVLIGLIVLKFLLQYFVLGADYELHRDEFLHLNQGNHLAWGYLSVPPFTSFIAYLIKILGNSIFWIKFFPALYGALTIYIVWKAITALNGNLFAHILGALAVLLSALVRLNTLYQPNSFDVLCWTTLYYLLLQFVKTENIKWLYMGSVVFALAFLNKYNIAFLILGVVPAILITKVRKLFLQWHTLGAVWVAFVLILPNIIWQYNNHFPVFHHLEELAATQLVNVKRIDFLKTQLLFFIGGLLPIIFSFYAFIKYKPFKRYHFFCWSFVFTIGFFLYFKAKDYYAIGIYPIYIAFGTVYLENWIEKARLKNYLQPIAFALPIVTFLPILQIAFPNKSPEYIIQHSTKYQKLGLLRWEDGKDHSIPQDFADMLGWKELAAKVDSAYLKLPGETLVLCDNYGQAGAINYYSKLSIQAVSFNADYIYWFDLSKKYQNLIRVKEAGNIEEELTETAPFFIQSAISGFITHPYAREYGTTIFVFTGAKIDIRERLKQEIEENNYLGIHK